MVPSFVRSSPRPPAARVRSPSRAPLARRWGAGVGPCALFVSTSADRLLKKAWFQLDEHKLENPAEQGSKPGEPVVKYQGRVLLTAEALAAPDPEGEEPGPSWSWKASDGSEGSITLANRHERLYLPKIGDLKDCLALVEKGGGAAGIVAGGYLVINVVVGNALEPRFMGRGLGLSPMIIVITMSRPKVPSGWRRTIEPMVSSRGGRS